MRCCLDSYAAALGPWSDSVPPIPVRKYRPTIIEIHFAMSKVWSSTVMIDESKMTQADTVYSQPLEV